MGKSQSKVQSGRGTGPRILPPNVKYMTEKDVTSMTQFDKWVEMGFPAAGSFSLNQLDQLKTCLETKEQTDADEFAALSRKQQKKTDPFKADWKAYIMWREEAELRERKRLKAESQTMEKERKKIQTDIQEQTNTLYPALTEVRKTRKPFRLDPDLDSVTPPPYAPVQNEPGAAAQDQDEEQAEEETKPGSTTAATAPLKLPDVRSKIPKSTLLQRSERLLNKKDIGSESQERHPFGSPSHNPVHTLPMMEAPGQGGPMLVFRPWTEQDIIEAMAHVSSPIDNFEQFRTQFEQFVKEYRPTMTELRRLMSKLLKHEFHKISAFFNNAGVMERRLLQADYSHGDNGQYRDAVTGLIAACRQAFPIRMNLAHITAMSQEQTETCSSFLSRLTAAFDLHSGLQRGIMGAAPLEAYEVHLKEHFLGRMKPEIAAAVRRSCISWKTSPLQTILEHATHEEDLLNDKEQSKKNSRQKKLEDAQLTMYRAMTSQGRGSSSGGGRGRSRGRGRRGHGRGGPGGWKGPYDPNVCYNCGKIGHWRNECPNNKKEDNDLNPTSD